MEPTAAATTAIASDGSAQSEKERGNRAFALGQSSEALEAYAAALAAIGQGEGKEEQELRSTLHSNRAACYLQLKRFGECIEEATAALALNSHLIKALYRRAQVCIAGHGFVGVFDCTDAVHRSAPHPDRPLSTQHTI